MSEITKITEIETGNINYYKDGHLFKREEYNIRNILINVLYFDANGSFYNGDEPAIIILSSNGNVQLLEWFNSEYETNRKDDLPNNIEYNFDGYVKSFSWFNKEYKLHRENNPAFILYNENNKLSNVGYFINGLFHRENDLADISYDDNLNIIYERYCKNGIDHRSNGPSIICNNNGSYWEKWFYNEKEYTTKVNKWIEENNFDKWQEMCEDDFNRMWFEIL